MNIDLEWCRVALARAGHAAGQSAAGLYAALFAFAAGRQADKVIEAIGAAAARWFPVYDMTKGARVAEFVAQTAHETGGYTRFDENLNYSAQGLADTWPTRFAVDPAAPVRTPNARARQIAHQPEAIADIVYARPKEGNRRPGDGWRYRGRGMLQLTFRNNYAAAGKRTGMDLVNHPELAADPALSLRIALDFWKQAGVNACCDSGDFYGARGLTNCGSRRPRVAPVGLADVARRRSRLMPLLSGDRARARAAG